MKNLIVSIAVGLLSGATVYLLIGYLFEGQNKSVNDDLDSDQDTPEDVEMQVSQEEPTVKVVN